MDRTSWIVIALCFVLLLAYKPAVEYFYPTPPAPAVETLTGQEVPAPTEMSPAPAATEAPELKSPAAAQPSPVASSTTAPEQTVLLENDFISAVLTTHGGGIKEVRLKKHLAEGVDPVTLNRGDHLPIFTISGWSGSGLNAYRIEENSPTRVTLSTEISPGLRLSRTYSLDGDYLITLTQSVFNDGTTSTALPVYSMHAGTAAPIYGHPGEKTYIGVSWLGADGDYSKHLIGSFHGFNLLGLQLSRGKTELTSDEGEAIRWSAVKTQFFTLIVCMEDSPADKVVATLKAFPELRAKNEAVPEGIIADLTLPGFGIEAKSSFSQKFSLYAGPKEDSRLSQLPYDQRHVMEFGWMGWISRPLLIAMNKIESVVGNYGLAIIILTILLKAVLWIPQSKANMSMKRMQATAPLVKELQEKYKDNPQKLNAEMLKVYQEYGVNPLGGCLPLLISMPVFLGFYYMLQSTIELRHAHFLWIHDLSQPDTVYRIPGLGFPINPMPILMGISMYISMHMTPQPQGVDNPMMKVMKFMPLIFLFFCYNFSSALSLYWTVSNLIGILQIYVNNKQGAPNLEEMKRQTAEKQKKRKQLGKNWPRP